MTAEALFGSLMVLLAWGGAAIFDKKALSHTTGMSPMTPVLVRMPFALLAVVVVGLWTGATREVVNLPPAGILYFGMSALLGAIIAQAAFYQAATVEQVSRVLAFAAGYPMVTVVVAVLVLAEPLTWQKVVGALLVTSGLIVLAAYRNVGRSHAATKL